MQSTPYIVVFCIYNSNPMIRKINRFSISLSSIYIYIYIYEYDYYLFISARPFVNYFVPNIDIGWMISGQETPLVIFISHWLAMYQLSTCIYLPSSHQVLYIINYIHLNHLHYLLTYL